MKLYGDIISGNSYKVQLLLARLQRSVEWIPVDLAKEENRTDEFLRMNPVGEIPLLELDDGRHIAESNAILCYLAEGTEYLPSDSYARALVLQWMFFEQNSHQPFVASARYIVHHLRRPARFEQRLQEKIDAGYRSLDVMDRHLRSRAFFVNDRCSVADIALYAYTHVAEEGSFDLARFPSLLAWLERMQSCANHVAMNRARLNLVSEAA